MNKYIKRLTYVSETQKLNPLSWLFMIPVATYAIIYVTGSEDISVMYEALDDLHDGAQNVWGISMLLLLIGTMVALLVRNRMLSRVVPAFGFLVWVYAGMAMVVTDFDYIGPGFSTILPNALFWAWAYIQSESMRRDTDAGIANHPGNSPR